MARDLLLVKLCLTFLVFLFLLSLASADVYDNPIVAYWSFDDSSDSTVILNDINNTVFNLSTFTGAIGYSSHAKLGLNSLQVNDSVESKVNTSFDPVESEDFSISVWFNASTISGDDTIFYFTDGGFGEQRLKVQTNSWRFRQGTGGSAVEVSTPATASVWTHIVVTSQAGDAMRIYINGDNKANTTLSADGPSGSPFTLGSQGSAATTYNGFIDDFVYFSTELTPQDVADLYNGGEGYPLNRTFRIALDSPANNTDTVNALNYFSAEFINAGNVSNATLQILNSSGSLILTNFTSDLSGNRNTTNLSLSLTSAGTYFWNYFAYNSSNTLAYSINRTINYVTYDLFIVDPITASPVNVSDNSNFTITFDFVKDNVNVTSGITYNNITVGGIQTTIVYDQIVGPNSTNQVDFSDFETDYGNYSNTSTGDNCEWWRDSGGTPSTNTGPDAGAGSSTWYVYMETSSGTNACGTQGQTAFLIGPTLNFTNGNATINFSYSMRGATIGELHLEENTTGEWKILLNKSGPQTSTGDFWNNTMLNLSSLGGGPNLTTLRFVGFRGSSFTGDIGLDNINITNGGVQVNHLWTTGNHWYVNVSAPAGLTGLQPLFVNFSSDGNAAYQTQGNAVNYSAGGGGDSCTYSSGDWVVTCSDNCIVSSPTTVTGTVYLQGSGNFYIKDDLQADSLYKDNACLLYKDNSANLIII